MATAELISIGTELLLGEIQDTNTRYLARQLRDVGINLFRATIVGDNPERISETIRQAARRADVVITTGGLGPTVDDPTRQAVADAVGVSLQFMPNLWEQIQERFTRWQRKATENNRRQAYVPTGAVVIENPVGTAPAFWIEFSNSIIISLPGVPREMEYLWQNSVRPLLIQHFKLNGTILARVLHTAGVGESQVDEWISDLETLTNPTVGLAAHPGQIDIRITARAGSVDEAKSLISPLADLIRQRVGDAIYGADADTLEGILAAYLKMANKRIVILENGLQDQLTHRLRSAGLEDDLLVSQAASASGNLVQSLTAALSEYQSEIGIGARLEVEDWKQILSVAFVTPHNSHELQRSYGGPPENGICWAVNTVLDFARRHIQ